MVARITSFCPLMPDKRSLTPPGDYEQFLTETKERIRRAQVRAALAVNGEVILLYWDLGRNILDRQATEGWGSKVIDRLSKDLKRDFPDIKGFSSRNLKYMRKFSQAYPDREIVQRVAALIPWRHNQILLDKVKDYDQRLWYAQKSLANNWSRDILAIQIESNLYQRQGGAVSNIEQTLPLSQSDLARQLIKDPYNFDFLSLGEDAQERDLEKALVDHIREFLLELGVGFAFMGSQYHIEVDGDDYYIDLLFYHVQLRCYVVIDLKVTEFKPEYFGKMNFYVSAVDDMLRHADDNPTIGLVLCRSSKKTTAEYAIRNVSTPIAVATHRLPEKLRQSLPTIEQLEMEIDTVIQEITAQTPEETYLSSDDT